MLAPADPTAAMELIRAAQSPAQQAVAATSPFLVDLQRDQRLLDELQVQARAVQIASQQQPQPQQQQQLQRLHMQIKALAASTQVRRAAFHGYACRGGCGIDPAVCEQGRQLASHGAGCKGCGRWWCGLARRTVAQMRQGA